jgi:tRNA-dihydrouridine synthase B
VNEIHQICRAHLADLHAFYGVETGMKIARKHIAWYTRGFAGSSAFRHAMNQLDDPDAQGTAIDEFFGRMAEAGDHLNDRAINRAAGTLRELAA